MDRIIQLFLSWMITVCYCHDQSDTCISSTTIKLCVNNKGVVSSIYLIPTSFMLETNAYSWMGDNNIQSDVLSVKTTKPTNSNWMYITKNISVYINSSQSFAQNVTLNETFSVLPSDPSIIEWNLTIIPQTKDPIPFSTAIATQFNLTANENDIYYWTMHGGPYSETFQNVLTMMNGNNTLRTQLGWNYIYDYNISKDRETMPFPLSIFTSKSYNCGVSFIYDINNDYLLAASLDINSKYQVFQRYYNKLVYNKPIQFTTYIRMNYGFNWRDTLNWTMNMYKELFLPSNEIAVNDIGMGMYSCASYDSINTTTVNIESGGNLNWDASFWWPYDGYDLPPVNNWTSDYGTGEEMQCGNYKHGQMVSRLMINNHYKNMKLYNNITTLAYFNLFCFGQNIIWPLDKNINYNKSDWKNSSIFLWEHLNDSAMLDAHGNIQHSNWQGNIMLDPEMLSWKTFLINQTKEHLISFENNVFNGISIDRLDHTTLYNFARDDGIAWCNQPCASQLIAFKHTFKEIGDIIHRNNSDLIITTNYQTRRMDMLIASDMIFSERSDTIPAMVNAIGLSSMGLPSVLWVYSSTEILNYTDGGPHNYFQQRLYMNVNLMAPVIGNDHSIKPDENVQIYYKLYGDLFRVLRGVQWWLKANTVEVINDYNDNGKGLINSFRKNMNNNIIIVIVLGDWNNKQIDINITGSKVTECESVNVESDGKWTKLNVNDDRVVNVTNIMYGCAVIQCIPM
eukprot:377009_1